MINHTRIFLAVLASVLLCAGCWDKVELENRGFVNAIGIDSFTPDMAGEAVEFQQSGGGRSRFRVSMATPSLEMLTGQGSEDTKSKAVKTAADETVSATMALVDVGASQRLYFGHVKAAVLGTGVLENENLFREAVDALERDREIGRKLIVLATEGEAKDILEGEGHGEPLFGMFITNMFKSGRNLAGTAFRMDLEELVQALLADGCAVIPKASLQGEAIRLGGAAVVSDGALTGWLDDGQTRGYLWALGRGEGARIVTDAYGGVPAPLSVTDTRSKITFSNRPDGGIICHIATRVKGQVQEYRMSAEPSGLDTTVLARAYETVIRQEIEHTFNSLRDMGADGLSLKERMRKFYPKLYEAVADDWDRAYNGMTVAPEAHVTVTNTGSVG